MNGVACTLTEHVFLAYELEPGMECQCHASFIDERGKPKFWIYQKPSGKCVCGRPIDDHDELCWVEYI